MGVSELRTKLAQVLRAMKQSHVVLERRHRPVAILVDPVRYQKMGVLLDLLEDRALGYQAHQREKTAREKDYLSLDQLEKRVGLK